MQDFLNHIVEAIEAGDLFKITLSKPKIKGDPLKNIFIRPISMGGQTIWNATYRYTTNDKTKNFESETLPSEIEELLSYHFYNADLFLPSKKVTCLQSKKGKSKVLVKDEKHTIQLESHDHSKKRLVPQSALFLKDLGITSSNGHVYNHAQDKFRQINKFVELLTNLTKNDTSIKTIYDMGSGKGYLTFALHHYYIQNYSKEIKTTGVEIRKDLVELCNEIAQKNNLSGLNFTLGSIDAYSIESTDMVIALHACDIATDMAISKGIDSNAKYIVVAPCCHKQIRKEMQNSGSSIDSILKFGIHKERQAEMITDTIRALLLESKGYEVKIFEFISSEHTGKNLMLTAQKKGSPDPLALQKVKELKLEFGIKTHFLETLLP